jgi:hypothetical protein
LQKESKEKKKPSFHIGRVSDKPTIYALKNSKQRQNQHLQKESEESKKPSFHIRRVSDKPTMHLCVEEQQTETETQYFVEGEQTETETKHLHKESEQRQKPSIWRRRVNRDRNPTFTKEE